MSSFENLPRDMQWKIIDFAKESVLNLRLASQTLRSCVNEYSVARSPKLVCELRIIGPSERAIPVNPSSTISVSMYIPVRNSAEFGLRLINTLSSDVIRDIGVKICKGMKVFRFQCYVRSESVVLECLRSCFGTQIERLELSKCTDQAVFGDVSKLLNGVQIQQLKISATILSHAFFKHLMTNVTVDKLMLHSRGTPAKEPVAMLLELSLHVRFLHINQHWVDGIERNRNFLFGVFDADWGSIIIDMFSRKLDSLCIDNFSFPEYLSINSADLIRNRLPFIGKKIWFEASCDQYPEGLKYTANSHLVQADSCDEIDRFLMIKRLDRLPVNKMTNSETETNRKNREVFEPEVRREKVRREHYFE